MKTMNENQEEINKERLGKIVALAKNGVGGERDTAIRMVKAICEKHGLVYEDVLNNIDVKEFTIAYKTKDEESVLVWCIARYGMLNRDSSNIWSCRGKFVGFKSTTEKYIEVLNAFSVLKGLYKKEKAKAEKALSLAFRNKHNLFYDPTEKEWEEILKERKENPKEERDRNLDLMAEGMSLGMESAEIHKQLK